MDFAPLWATIDNQIEAVAGLGIPLHSVKLLAANISQRQIVRAKSRSPLRKN